MRRTARLLVVPMMCLSLGNAPVRAQDADAPVRRAWGAASVTYGTVDARRAANTDGLGLELSGGIAVRHRLRVGFQFVEWWQLPGDLFDPRWRARTVKGVLDYRVPRTILGLTTGFGVTRAWDEVAPRGSARTLVAETGLTLEVPRGRSPAFRLCLSRDWAIGTPRQRGPVSVGTMNQWHAGAGMSVH